MKKLRLLIALVLAFGVAAAAEADPIIFGNPLWYEFLFGGPGSFATACTAATCAPGPPGVTTFAPNPPWTFVVPAGGGTLTVTDAFLIGDRFQVFNMGAPLLLTSLPVGGGTCGNNPVPCLANPNVSHGSVFLAPGAYSLTIQAVLSPFGGGAAFFRTDPAQQVPEPGTLLLLGAGLAGLGFLARRKRS